LVRAVSVELLSEDDAALAVLLKERAHSKTPNATELVELELVEEEVVVLFVPFDPPDVDVVDPLVAIPVSTSSTASATTT
jgi:hypothetical protein